MRWVRCMRPFLECLAAAQPVGSRFGCISLCIPSWLKLRPGWSPQLAPHWLALLLLVVPGTDTAAQGSTVNVGKRTALVLGNQDYKFAPLGNPLNDARAISVSLRELGFDVLMVKDGKLSGMRETLQQASLRFVSNGVAFFYYAGHAVQYRGVNYLVPVDYSPEDLASFPEGTLSLDEVLGVMAEAGVGLRILVLDSCRDNPFGSAAEVWGGAGQHRDRGETLVAYATTAGNVAEDRASGPDGSFTASLITALEVPNLDIHDVFRLVRGDVRKRHRTPSALDVRLDRISFHLSRAGHDRVIADACNGGGCGLGTLGNHEDSVDRRISPSSSVCTLQHAGNRGQSG